MSLLKNRLDDWVLNNFITREQAKRIMAYEVAKPSGQWILYGFLILGASVIGIGMISLIAANWKDIPDLLKLLVDVSFLILLASGAYFSWIKNKSILFEVLLLLFVILCLASIGLISQIYHTNGTFYQALFLWGAITSGVAATSKRSFTPFIWASCFFSGLADIIINFSDIFEKNSSSVFVAITLFGASLALFCRSIGGKESGQYRALISLTAINGMLTLILGEFQHYDPKAIDFNMILAFIPGYIFAILLAFGIWLSLDYKKAQKILLLLALMFYLVPFHLPLLTIHSKVAHAICSITVLATLSVFLASIKRRRLFQTLLVALGLRFLMLYFQALGGLATTGFGLIFSGIIIILTVATFNKYSKEITIWAEGLIE